MAAKMPRNLHVSHSWGGGIDRWVRDFCNHDAHSENLSLENIGTFNCYGLGLRLVDGASREELGKWYFRDPISETRIHHPEYKEVLKSIVADYEISHVYLSCLTGHSLDIFDLGVPVTKIHHDYYPYCPNIYIHYGGVCGSCDDQRLGVCLENNPVDFANRKSSVGHWLDLREAYVEALCLPHVEHICPSANIAGHLGARDPRFARLKYAVIPHGINMDKQNSFGGAEEGRHLRAVVLGTQHIVKGLDILREAFDRARLIVDFTFLGGGPGGSELATRYGVNYVERYEHGTLDGLLSEGRFDFGLFLSVFPETFCYTLSEVWAHCIPACTSRVGSFEDRIEEGENGLFFGLDSHDLVDFLLNVNWDREQLRRVSRALQEVPVRSVTDMVEDYYRLRDDSAEASGVQRLSPKPPPVGPKSIEDEAVE